MSLASSIANRAYRLASGRAYHRLVGALKNPRIAQARVLERTLGGIELTAFGNEHGLRPNMSMEAFRDQVPLRTFDDFQPYVERAAAGEVQVLTSDPIRFFEPTAGSSGAAKLIPYTDTLLAQYGAATSAWVHDLLSGSRPMRNGRSYWAVSPPAEAKISSGGIPIGQAHDSDYFPKFLGWLLDAAIGLPRAVSHVTDIELCRALTIRALVSMDDLSFISVWSPSFLTILAERLSTTWNDVLNDLEYGTLSFEVPQLLERDLHNAFPARVHRARLLRRKFGGICPQNLSEIWPNLSMISCWCDGHAARVVEPMRRRFPDVTIQPKGLMSTEAVTSLPLRAFSEPVAAVTSHVLEFLSEHDAGRPLWLDELEVGARYEVVVSTGGGLYRCRTRDLVEVTGIARATPMLRFAGRCDGASDLAGEKLTPAFVERAIEAAANAAGENPVFAMMVPIPLQEHKDGCAGQYVVVCDGVNDTAAFEIAIEAILQENHHYKLCRDLGQLAATTAQNVPNAEIIDVQTCETLGQRAGTVKPRALDARPEIAKAFGIPMEVPA